MQVVGQEEQALLWDAGARQEQEQEERNRFAPGYKPSPLQCLISASLPNFMILYDTLGIYVRLGALGVPLRLLMPLYFVLLAWQ